MAAFVTLMAAVTFWPGAYYIRLHEGDTLHLISILLRMEEGQRPHLDFMTPIGALAFAPIVLFMKAGFGVGTAILAAQYLVVALLAPAIWWVALSRYPGRLAWLFAGVAMTLILGMMFGGHRGVGLDFDALQSLGMGSDFRGGFSRFIAGYRSRAPSN